MRRGLSAHIDLTAARKNLEVIRKATCGLAPVIAVVKADGYGHGAEKLARVFLKADAKMLAVAFVSEARELRDSGIKAPILVLFDRSDIPEYFDMKLTPVLHDLKTAKEFSEVAQKRNTSIDVHVKLDTGMGRMGLEDPADLKSIEALDGLNIIGIMSHLSDADLADMDCTIAQVEKLNKFATIIERPVTKHISNSAAVFACPEARLDAVRPGIALYGISPFEDERDAVKKLEPVMRVSANILTIRKLSKGSTVSYGRTFTTERDTLSAVIACGYADGYPRALSNLSSVLVNGSRAPIMGRVCMDLMMADITEIEGVDENMEATLLGSDGTETISAWDLAKDAGTIPYEVLTSFGRSAMRTY